MVKRLLLACLLAVAPALAAVDTTTITGSVVDPAGTAATGGTVRWSLSMAGTALDGATPVTVSGDTVCTLTGAGAFSGCALVPNDAITPTGTYYTAKFSVTTAQGVRSWTRMYSVTTSPDPVALGNVTALNVAPGITVDPAYTLLQDEGSSVTQRRTLNFTGAGVSCADNSGSSRTDCTVPAASFSDSSGLAAILSDESGASGGFTRSSATVLRNSSLVTVCASGCDYSSIQAALDGTTGTVSQPVQILVMPGGYTECLTVDAANDYTTIKGAGYLHTRISCATASTEVMKFDYSSGDIDAFEVDGVALLQTIAHMTVHTTDVSGDFRVDATFRDCYVGGVNSTDAFLFRGTSSLSPTKPPSELRLFNNIIETPIDLIGVGNFLNVTSIGNVIRSSADVAGEQIARCFHDIGANGSYSDTLLYSSGDYCYARCDAVTGTPPTNHASCGAIHLSTGFARAYFVGLTAHVVNTANATIGPQAVVVGSTGTSTPNVELVDSTIRLETQGASQSAYGVAVLDPGRVVLRNVRIESYGPGTETDIATGSGTTSLAYIYLDSVSYNTTSNLGSGVIADLNPKMLRSFLRAVDSVALPATGAPLDANSEYGLFDAASDENRSWRNERVSDFYQSGSLQAAQFRVYWSPLTDLDGGDVVWRVGICAAANDVAFPCAVSSFSSVTDTEPNAGNGKVYISDWAALPTGILTAGHGLVVTASRDADNVADTVTGDVALVGVEISYGVR